MKLPESPRSQARFGMKYEGPAFSEGTMSVRDLGPALQSLGEVVDEVNGMTNREFASISVNLTATSRGSFLIDLDVIQAFQAIGGFVTTAPQIIDIIFGDSGVIALIKWLKGQSPTLIRGEGNQERIENNDGETRIVQKNVIVPLFSKNINVNINNIVRPIEKEGTNSVGFYAEGQPLEQVSKGDLLSFDIPEQRETLIDNVHEKALSIVGPVFEEGNKWFFDDGEGTIRAAMKDKAFQDRIDNKMVSFTKGDMLICELRTIQKRVNVRIRTEFEVIRVISYQSVRRQLHFRQQDS